jgi:mannosyltransferase
MQPTAVNESSAPLPLQSRSAHWAYCVTLALVIFAGTLVRFLHLASKPFWFDECFSVEVARIDWLNFLHLVWWREANMSLYYVLLRAWLHFGQSPLFIRSFSVVISAATLPAIYWLARLLYDRRVALIATALFALNGYSVRYAQEARSYALFVLLAILASGFLILLLNEPTRRNWQLYVWISTLAVYAHFYALLLLASHWVFVTRVYPPPGGSESPHQVLRRAWKTIAIAVLPLLIFVAKTGAGPIRWIHRPSVRDLVEFFEHLSGGNGWLLAALYGAILSVTIISAGGFPRPRDRSGQEWRTQFLLIWLLLPISITVLLSFARPVFLGRYMIFCLPALLILVAAGLARLPRWVLPPALAIVLFLALQGISFVYAHDFDDERDASGAAANFILGHTAPGDAVIFHIAETRVPYEFFRSLRVGTNTASPQFTGPLGPEILFPQHGAGLEYRDFTGKPTADFLRTVTQGHPRIWLMLMNNGSTENPDPTTLMLKQILPETFPKIQRWNFAKVEVRLYSRE